MKDVSAFLFGANGMLPHGYCFLWNPSLLWLFVISNLVTALSYFSIPLALGFFAYKRKDINFKWMLFLFSVFIFTCGITHLLSAVTIWNPVYGLAAIAEALTAIVSVITAVLLWPLIPEVLRLPSPSALLLANKKLADEILYHKETKAQLSRLNTELDRLVELRTRELQASELRFRTIFEQAPLGITIVNSLTGHFHESNPRLAEITGRTKEELMNSDWMHITHPDDIQKVINNISLLTTHKFSIFATTMRYIRPDNSIVWVKLLSVPISTETPSPYLLQMVEDITEARLAEQKNQQLGNILEQSINEIYILNSKTLHFEHVNQGGINNLGYSLDELKNMTMHDIKAERDHVFFNDLIGQLLNGAKDQVIFETTYQRKNGTRYPVEVCLQIYRSDPCYLVAICLDISQHKAIEQQLEHLAHYDPLTNLPNRLLFNSRVDYELIVAERHKKTFALLFIDLDHFKNINDSLGHSIGDQVLIEVGQRLLACVREEDTVARLGGDEYNMLLADSDEIGAAIVANKIIASLAVPILYQSYQLYITPSIGISLYPDNGDSYETLSKNADNALYQAKKLGRNQYQFFTPSMQQQSQRRLDIEIELRQAIARHELMVYFQPQVNTETGQIIGAEALLRWQHPDYGMVSPAEFIPVAEDCGLILSIGDWALEQSVVQARQWHDAGFPLTIAVNLSLAQFRDNALFGKVKQILNYARLPPQYLELELTESIAMQNAEMAIAITQQLTGLGIKLSIDDFGTGYSSLNYLQRFSLDKLKIDQSFTWNMINNTESENIVDAIISLAKSLNLKTIAEGVETRQQLDMLKHKDCDESQGYYFSEAVPADEFMVLLRSRKQWIVKPG